MARSRNSISPTLGVGFSGPSLKEKKARLNVNRFQLIEEARSLGFRNVVGNQRSSVRQSGEQARRQLEGFHRNEAILELASQGGIIGKSLDTTKEHKFSRRFGPFESRNIVGTPKTQKEVQDARLNILFTNLKKEGLTISDIIGRDGSFVGGRETIELSGPKNIRDISRARSNLAEARRRRNIETSFIGDTQLRKQVKAQDKAEFDKIDQQFIGTKKTFKNRQLQEFENRNTIPFIQGGPSAPIVNVPVPRQQRVRAIKPIKRNVNISVRAPRNARFDGGFSVGRII